MLLGENVIENNVIINPIINQILLIVIHLSNYFT